MSVFSIDFGAGFRWFVLTRIMHETTNHTNESKNINKITNNPRNYFYSDITDVFYCYYSF